MLHEKLRENAWEHSLLLVRYLLSTIFRQIEFIHDISSRISLESWRICAEVDSAAKLFFACKGAIDADEMVTELVWIKIWLQSDYDASHHLLDR